MAYVLQAHHVLMDGGAATQLFGRILGVARDSRKLAAPQYTSRRGEFTPMGATQRGIGRLLTGLPDTAGRIASAVTGMALNPVGTVNHVRSASRVVRPQQASVPAVLKGGPRTAWRFGTLEIEVEELKKAGAAVGGTVNDAFAAAVLGGLRESYLLHGVDLPDLPISMPVSVRGNEMGGNRFAGASAPFLAHRCVPRCVRMSAPVASRSMSTARSSRTLKTLWEAMRRGLDDVLALGWQSPRASFRSNDGHSKDRKP